MNLVVELRQKQMSKEKTSTDLSIQLDIPQKIEKNKKKTVSVFFKGIMVLIKLIFKHHNS